MFIQKLNTLHHMCEVKGDGMEYELNFILFMLCLCNNNNQLEFLQLEIVLASSLFSLVHYSLR